MTVPFHGLAPLVMQGVAQPAADMYEQSRLPAQLPGWQDGIVATEAPVASPNAAAHSSAHPPGFRHEATSSVVKLKGLPYNCTEQQIRDFFKGFSIKKVAFVYEPDGHPSGLAFAEFDDKEDALKAFMTKKWQYIGDRCVRLLIVSKQEMDEQVTLGTLAVPRVPSKNRPPNMAGRGRGRMQPPNIVYYTPGPIQLAPQPMIQQQRPTVVILGPGAQAPQGMQQQAVPVDASGNWQAQYPTYQAVQHPSMATAYAAAPSMHTLTNQFQGMSMGTNTSEPQPQIINQQVQMQPVPTVMLPAGSPALTQLSPAPPFEMPPSGGRTVKIVGLPYRSTPADILNFFRGFQYLPDSLQIGVDALGRPSGDAWLTFVSPTEALRAVQGLNRRYLGNRYLELRVC